MEKCIRYLRFWTSRADTIVRYGSDEILMAGLAADNYVVILTAKLMLTRTSQWSLIIQSSVFLHVLRRALDSYLHTRQRFQSQRDCVIRITVLFRRYEKHDSQLKQVDLWFLYRRKIEESF